MNKADEIIESLINYQVEYQEQTQDYAPGNRYWADKLMTIIGNAKKYTANEQEDEKEIALRVINDKFLKGINEDDYPNLNVNDILHWMEGK